MQLLQAGPHQLVLLEYDLEALTSLSQQANFLVELQDTPRAVIFDLWTQEREAPLLLFDAAEPANLGWFSRCQFYIDGATGQVLQTPISIGNKRDRGGALSLHSVRLRLAKELSPNFRLPGKQALSEQVVYGLLFNFLQALQQVGVAVCGGPVFVPLSGRRER
ncbi:MAG: hypothetical protein FJW30_21295 [Acidobacteria bacterium]|nr:hypothetical protein [Acidobacteriota bacterium]